VFRPTYIFYLNLFFYLSYVSIAAFLSALFNKHNDDDDNDT